MRAELGALHDALPRLDWLQIAERREGNIKLTPLDAAPESRNLRQLKKEITVRWGTVPLIDILKEAVLRTGCLAAATSAAARGDLDRRPGETVGTPGLHLGALSAARSATSCATMLSS